MPALNNPAMCLLLLSSFFFLLSLNVAVASNLSASFSGSGVFNLGTLPPPRLDYIGARQQEFICPIPGGVECAAPVEYCCPPTTVCQQEDTRIPLPCCPIDALQCGGLACCTPGISVCCPETALGCCPIDDQGTPTATTKAQTSTIASASVSLAAPSFTTTRIPKATVPFDYQDILQPRARSKEQNPVVRKEAVDSLFENMCRGIEKFGDSESQSIILTHRPSLTGKNRKEACGKVDCPVGFQCDEFPFASTEDGGLDAIANCIIALGNSIQGGFIRSLLSSRGITPGNDYLLQLTNVKCEDFLKKRRRREILSTRQQDSTSGLTSQMQTLNVQRFGSFVAGDLFDHGLYYIGDLSSGRYTVNVNLNSGAINTYYIIDYQGTNYSTAQGDSNTSPTTTGTRTHALSFALQQDAFGVTLMLDSTVDYDVSASISHDTTSGGSQSAPSSSAQASPSQPSAGDELSLSRSAWVLCLLILCIIGVF